VYKFRNKKSGKEVIVEGHYNWASDRFHTWYLGRHFCDGGDEPHIGKNWKFVESVSKESYAQNTSR